MLRFKYTLKLLYYINTPLPNKSLFKMFISGSHIVHYVKAIADYI
jgi:hypothetical protein